MWKKGRGVKTFRMHCMCVCVQACKCVCAAVGHMDREQQLSGEGGEEEEEACLCESYPEAESSNTILFTRQTAFTTCQPGGFAKKLQSSDWLHLQKVPHPGCVQQAEPGYQSI